MLAATAVVMAGAGYVVSWFEGARASCPEGMKRPHAKREPFSLWQNERFDASEKT